MRSIAAFELGLISGGEWTRNSDGTLSNDEIQVVEVVGNLSSGGGSSGVAFIDAVLAGAQMGAANNPTSAATSAVIGGIVAALTYWQLVDGELCLVPVP